MGDLARSAMPLAIWKATHMQGCAHHQTMLETLTLHKQKGRLSQTREQPAKALCPPAHPSAGPGRVTDARCS